MKKLVLLLLMIGLALPMFGQDREEMPEVVVKATKYKYLNQVGFEDVAIPVKELQKKVAEYEVSDADFYRDDYDLYYVTFYIPEGKVLAAYDGEGNLIRTAEKYKDVALPKAVMASIADKYPKWEVSNDVYLVNYYHKKGAKKVYKLKLVNGDKKMRLKVNEEGEML